MALNLPNLTAAFHNVIRQVATCPHRDQCLTDCGNLIPERPPSPDYLGPRYAGLAIIGANPGNAANGGQQAHDEAMEALMHRVGQERAPAAYHELMALLVMSMRGWKQVVSAAHQMALDYDIGEIAYIDIVKCKTFRGGADPFRTVGGTVARRCWETYTAHQLDLLQPTHVIGLWKPIGGVLRRLGYDVEFGEFRLPEGGAHPIEVVYGFHNGRRNLPAADRLVDALRVVDDFRGRRAVRGNDGDRG
ncbi:hypothetical protein [Azospirillum argentinense]|uniref:Uncharacterized protein n=1 Tax=Azospirillum brasilense TaxID=192 RepID=A0A4D8QAP7_AZOBR|nr:hypothetical protein [Azospirillum argentinense]QCO07447.1 hypothetical protein D3867_36805 [Azospirillum argentinense]